MPTSDLIYSAFSLSFIFQQAAEFQQRISLGIRICALLLFILLNLAAAQRVADPSTSST